MEDFLLKHPIALTVIFLFLIPSKDSPQIDRDRCDLRNIIILNKKIHKSFFYNDIFWLWYIKFQFDCDICTEDGQKLKSFLNEDVMVNPDSGSFWRRECKVQLANKRLRRQWCVKFSNRVLLYHGSNSSDEHRNPLILEDSVKVPPITLMKAEHVSICSGEEKQQEIDSDEQSVSTFSNPPSSSIGLL
jgi:hypothetical protein